MPRRSTLPPHVLPIAAFALVAVGLLVSAPLLSRSLRAQTRRRAELELGAVAELKARQIVQWRADHLRVVRFAAAYPSVRRAVEASTRGAPDAALRAHVAEVLGQVANLQSYLRLALLAGAEHEVAGWARPGAHVLPPSPGLLDAARAAADGAASELRLDSTERPYLDVAVAIRGGDTPFVLFARADAEPLFEDVLDRWPVPSQSAAGSIGFREGDHVRLVIPARFRVEGIPHVERIPIADLRRPVAQAFHGATGLIEGLDFGGTPIFVASREVAGTPWRVQARIAVAEIEAPLERPLRIIYGLGGALLAAAAIMLALSWRQQRARAALDARLADAQERLALAVTGTHSVWDWDLARGTLHLDPPCALGGGDAVAELTGTVDELVPRIAHPDDAPAVRARLDAHLRGETELFESEHRIPTGRGAPAWIRVRGRVSRRDPTGHALRFAAVVSDVTERRRMQAQLELSQRMAGLGTLAAGVAHEINNPLASVSANLDFLGRSLGGTGELAGVVAEARDGAERVRDVVRGLRAFSTPARAGRAPADVRVELEAAIRLARNEIRHRARLEVHLGEVPLVEAGAHELGQVFLNLLLNAAQAIPEGHAGENLITVEAGRSEDGGASIRIRDTGVGIAPQVLERIFEPFFTTKPLGVGTGLGLAIAHRIVADAGGRIDVETQVGDGTSFHVTLPAARAPLAGGPARPTPRPPERAPGDAPRRVLVVDDDPLVTRAVVRTLAARFDVASAASAAEALARLEAGERFDAVLCDLMMPQMTGMELHARVAARDPALARRMLFMTGGAFTEASARFVAEAGAPCLEKPFDPGALRDAVERAAAA